jgi:hypothetical protein
LPPSPAEGRLEAHAESSIRIGTISANVDAIIVGNKVRDTLNDEPSGGRRALRS